MYPQNCCNFRISQCHKNFIDRFLPRAGLPRYIDGQRSVTVARVLSEKVRISELKQEREKADFGDDWKQNLENLNIQRTHCSFAKCIFEYIHCRHKALVSYQNRSTILQHDQNSSISSAHGLSWLAAMC